MVYYAIALSLYMTASTREVRPIATPATKGAWYRAWRLVSLDGVLPGVK